MADETKPKVTVCPLAFTVHAILYNIAMSQLVCMIYIIHDHLLPMELLGMICDCMVGGGGGCEVVILCEVLSKCLYRMISQL